MQIQTPCEPAPRVAILQEEEYWFPYHYVSRYRHNLFRQHFNDSWGINYVSTIEYLLEKVRSLAPASVVDIGCGDGRMTREIALSLDAERIVGVDYSRRAIELAKAMNYGLSSVDFLCVDITASPDIGNFDLAILMEVFEHISPERTRDFLAGVHLLLKKGGRILLTVPHVNKPVEYKHYQHFSVESLRTHLREGFEITNIMPFEKMGIRRRLLNTILANRLFILNNSNVLAFLYRWYKNNLFHCAGERDCQRVFVEAVAK